MKYKTCSFTGHRILPKENLNRITEKTKNEIERLIGIGVENFISGGAIGFDTLCGKLVLELKENYKNIRLIMALPCLNQDKYWSDKQKAEYKNMLEQADKIIYVSKDYHNGCMLNRNRYMVDNSTYIISYCTKAFGGTYYTTKYALDNKKNVIHI